MSARAAKRPVKRRWDPLAPLLRRTAMEHLEERRLLSVNPFSNYLTSLQAEVTSLQNSVDAVFDAASSLKTLPFIGQQLGAIDQVKTAIDTAGDKITNELGNAASTGATGGELQSLIWMALGTGNGGLGLVTNENNIRISNFNTDGNGVVTSSNIEVWVHVAPSQITNSLSFNLGLPSLPLQVSNTVGLTANVGFDLDLALDWNGGAVSVDQNENLHDFNASQPAAQLAFGATASLTGGALTASLGFLEGTLTPNGTNSLSATITVPNLGNPSINFSGNANVNLAAHLGVSGSSGAEFPSIDTDIVMSWSQTNGTPSLQFAFDNTNLDLGQFLSFVKPVVEDLQQYLQPLSSILNVLNAPIPGLDALPGQSHTSLLTLLQDLTGAQTSQLNGVISLVSEVSTLAGELGSASAGDATLPFGNFTMDAAGQAALEGLGGNLDYLDDVQNAQGLITDFQNQLTGAIDQAVGGGSPAAGALDTMASNFSSGGNDALDFPLLDNPSSLVNLLFGQNVSLVQFTGNFNISGGTNIILALIPIWGPFSAEVSLNAGLSLSGSITVGYDTYGLQQAYQDAQHGNLGNIANDVANGFYILGGSSGSFLSVTGTVGISAGVGVNLGFANGDIGLTGGVEGNVTLHVADNDQDAAHDGRVHLNELEEEFPDIFAASGGIDAFISATLQYDSVFGSGTITLFNLAQTTIWDSSSVNPSTGQAPPPTISSVGPAIGTANGGTEVTIYGTNLQDASEVDFDGPFHIGAAVTSFVADEPTYITLYTPEDPVNIGDSGDVVNVQVVTPSGFSSISSNDAFEYLDAPTMTDVSGTPLPISEQSGTSAGGTTVDIYGRNLANATSVDFGTTPGYIVSDSPTEIVALSPAVTFVGDSETVDVSVTTAGGTSAPPPPDLLINPYAFTFVESPIVEGVVQSGGPLSGGNEVAIAGEFFGDNDTGVGYVTGVYFGNTFVPVSPSATSQVTMVGSASAWETDVSAPGSTKLGTVDVRVVTSGGGGESAITSTDEYTYYPAPVIEAVWGPLAEGAGTNQGAQVMLDGTDFEGAYKVTFNGVAATLGVGAAENPDGTWSMTVKSPTVSTTGKVLVQIYAFGGISTSTLDTGDEFTYLDPPVAASMSPAVGPEDGGATVTIFGSNLVWQGTGSSSIPFPVQFGDEDAESYSYNTANGSIIAVAPAGTGNVPVTVITPAGKVTVASGDFTYLPPPIVTSVALQFGGEAVGSVAGGTWITIEGTGFSGADQVDFGSNAAMQFSVISDTEMLAESPGGGGNVDVTVTTPSRGTSLTSPADKFKYAFVAPVIDGFDNDSGPQTGNNVVKIFGQNFLGTSDVTFANFEAISFQVVSSSEIDAVAPAGTPGTAAVLVISEGMPSTDASPNSNLYTYLAVPTITSVDPSSGQTVSTTPVQITGTDLIGAQEIFFGSAMGQIISTAPNPNGGDILVAQAPTSGAGTVDVQVVGSDGEESATTPVDQFTYFVPQPIVSGVSPDQGNVSGQTSVTISGSYLAGATKVLFGGVETSSFTVNADGTITAFSPMASMAGPVNVQVVTAGGTSDATPATDQFTYGLTPSVSQLFFNSGPIAGFDDEEVFGANLSNVTAVYFGATPAPQFDDALPNTILVTVPEHLAGTVDVTVVSPDGTSQIVPWDQFTYTAAPIVESVGLSSAPEDFGSAGPLAGGTAVTISGFNLSDATGVSFGDVPAASFTVNDDGTISAVSPAGSAGAVNVSVTSPEGTSAPAGFTGQFTYEPVPSIIGLNTSSGPLAGGNSVTIAGSGLNDAIDVDFGQIPAVITGVFDDYITVAAPAGSLGTVDITVTGAGGTSITSSADQYTYEPLPAITSLSATSGAIEGGTPVTITGTGFSGATQVSFGPDAAVPVLSVSDTQIIVVSPASLDGTGTIDVTVTSPNGTSPVNEPADQFTYTHAPFISEAIGENDDGLSSFQPVGLVTGGASITIEGFDLSTATAVDFGDTPAASFTINPDGSITAVSPMGNVGTVDVSVTTPIGTSDISAADQFTYVAVPTVTAVSPTTGGAEGGTLVEIDGVGLANAQFVEFGGIQATIMSDTDTQSFATTSFMFGNSEATVDVTVETALATSATSPADQFTFMPAPSVSTISASVGSVFGGDPITITGYGFTNAEVFVGGVAASIINNTDSEIDLITPESPGDAPGAVDLSIVTQYGTSVQSFRYAVAPVVTSISQSNGPIAGGDVMFVYGNDLFDTGTQVEFGGVAATILGESTFLDNGGPGGASDQIEVAVPSGVPSTVDVTVVTAGGTSATSPGDQYTYVDVPVVTGLNVTAGPDEGGTTVTIFGSGLANASQVDFGIDGLAATLVSDADGELVVVSPSDTPQSLGTQDVIVVTPGGTSATSPADQFTYTDPPTVNDVVEDQGFTTGGDTITIFGTNLETATAVNFGANAASIISESPTSIQVLSPFGDPGTVDVTVVTPGGASAMSPQDQFTYLQLVPTVSGLSQSVGPATGGSSITISGNDLENASAVYFGSVAGTIDSSTADQIVVTSPSGILGTVDVTVQTPGGSSETSLADQFTGIAAPSVSGLSASYISDSGGTDVLIYGSALDGATAIDFGRAAGTVLVDADTYIIAATPAGTAGALDVTVTTPYGTSATSNSDKLTYVAPPTATAESFTLTQDTSLGELGGSDGILAGAVDPQGFSLSADLLVDPTNGSLVFGSDGSFLYTPNPGFYGTDSFTYQADDGYAVSTPTTVSLTIVENDPLATQVTNNSVSGPGSLLQALTTAAADTSGNPYSIQFVLPAGQQTINVQSFQPTVSDPLLFSLDATQNVTITNPFGTAFSNLGYNEITETGAGTLTLNDGYSINGNISIDGGVLQLDEPATPVIASGVGVDISGDGSLQVAGSVSDLVDGVNISNSSTASAGIEVSGNNQIVGNISGTGNLVVDSGAGLTASSVVENTLTIGASGILTIAPATSSDDSASMATSNVLAATVSNPAITAPLARIPAAEEAVASSANLAMAGRDSTATVISGNATSAGVSLLTPPSIESNAEPALVGETTAQAATYGAPGPITEESISAILELNESSQPESAAHGLAGRNGPSLSIPPDDFRVAPIALSGISDRDAAPVESPTSMPAPSPVGASASTLPAAFETIGRTALTRVAVDAALEGGPVSDFDSSLLDLLANDLANRASEAA